MENDGEAGPSENLMAVLADIQSSNGSLQAIIEYCKTSYEDDRAEVFQRTKQYAEDALTNAAYQIHRGTSELLALLEQQTFELQNLQANIDTMETKTIITREGRQSATLKASHPRKTLHGEHAAEDIEPAACIPAFQWEGGINLDALQMVGCSLIPGSVSSYGQEQYDEIAQE